jgi:hypothetical protein
MKIRIKIKHWMREREKKRERKRLKERELLPPWENISTQALSDQ